MSSSSSSLTGNSPLSRSKSSKRTGRWRVEVQLSGLRKRGRFDTHEEARAAEGKWKEALASGETSGATSRDPLTLLQLLDKAAALLWNGSAHGKLSEVKVRQIAAWLGDPQLSRVDTRWIDDVVIRLRSEGKKPATINRYLSAVHAILAWGAKRKLIDLPEFSWQEEEEGRVRWLTPQEETKLLATLRVLGYEEIADFCVAAIDTGCRRSELLHAGNDQLDGNWLRLWKTKSGHARSVPLTPRAQAILADRLPWSFTEAQLRYAWAKAKLAMGLKDDEHFVVHALRHTCATRLIERGVNLRVVQQFMGHRVIQTTLRYAHVSDDTLANAAAVLSVVTGRLTSNDNGKWGTKGGAREPARSRNAIRARSESVQ